MKKRLIAVLSLLVCTFACALGLVACSSGNGTYYAYVNGNKVESTTIVIDGEKATWTIDGTGTEYTVKISGKDITLSSSIEAFGVTTTTTHTGTIEDGVIHLTKIKLTVATKVTETSEDLYYCKDGKTPPQA